MRSIVRLLWLGISCALLVGADCALAKILEERISVPVNVMNRQGKEIRHDIAVTLFYDWAAPRPYPLLVLNHGRSYKPDGRAELGRARYSAASRFFADLGFMVAVPTRVGYGVSGGEDVEDSGACNSRNYPPVYHAAAVQTLRVVETLRERSYVARDRAVVVGQSFGGATAIAVAALAPAGVAAAINFAGGGGGNPETHPGAPCSRDALTRMFSDYGKTARIPTLWVYTENDKYMGAKYPRQWFDAFRAAGGAGEYVLYPPNGEDGHSLFTRAPQVWQPRVLEFLRPLGYKPLFGK